MQIEGTTNFHNIFEPTYLSVMAQDGQNIQFQPSTINRWFDHHMVDFPESGEMQTYKLTSSDGTISFHYMIHPTIWAIVIPPNSIEMEHTQKNKWISDMIQRFFEYLAHKHQYRLIVGITPQSAAAFKNRVMNILRAVGYYVGPTSEKSDIYFGEHQSTYTGNGIPEIGTEAEYMLTPTIK